MARTKSYTNVRPRITDPSERIDSGIRRLEVITKLLSGFSEDHANTLEQWENLTLVEMLEEVVRDLREGHNGMIAEANALHAINDAGGAR